MRSVRTCLGLTVLVLAAMAAGTRADWNPGDPAKWVQLPDFSPNGMDVYDTRWPQNQPTSNQFKILADDWLCTSVDPVTDIHIWGSWLNNHLPFGGGPNPGNPGAVTFKLSIHEDVPAGVDAPWSHPGPQVWSMVTPASAVRLYAPNPEFPTIIEQFYDPNINQIIGQDNEVYQYNFTDLVNPFIQQGTTSQPKIYWLDVQALSEDPTAIFGWKTAEGPHRLDDAVYADTDGFGGPLLPLPGNPLGVPWRDMHYPSGHQFQGQSFDLSFVITTVPEPGTLSGLLIAAVVLSACRRRDS